MRRGFNANTVNAYQPANGAAVAAPLNANPPAANLADVAILKLTQAQALNKDSDGNA